VRAQPEERPANGVVPFIDAMDEGAHRNVNVALRVIVRPHEEQLIAAEDGGRDQRSDRRVRAGLGNRLEPPASERFLRAEPIREADQASDATFEWFLHGMALEIYYLAPHIEREQSGNRLAEVGLLQNGGSEELWRLPRRMALLQSLQAFAPVAVDVGCKERLHKRTKPSIFPADGLSIDGLLPVMHAHLDGEDEAVHEKALAPSVRGRNLREQEAVLAELGRNRTRHAAPNVSNQFLPLLMRRGSTQHQSAGNERAGFMHADEAVSQNIRAGVVGQVPSDTFQSGLPEKLVLCADVEYERDRHSFRILKAPKAHQNSRNAGSIRSVK